MSRNKFAVLAVVMVAVLAIASVAVAELAFSVTSSKASVSYLQPFKITVAASELSTGAITVQYRYPDGAWTKLKTISAERAAEATSYSVTVPASKVKAELGFRAIAGSVESSVTTVTVKARLTKPSLPKGKVRVNKTVVVTGQIKPAHAYGTDAIVLRVYKAGVLVTEVPGKITSKKAVKTHGASMSKWAASWKPTEKGVYELVAVHADAAHAESVSSTVTVSVTK
jgi:hypothetical protein